MLAVINAAAARLAPLGIRWRLSGSAARLVRGEPVRPGDIDIEVAEVDGPRAARALGLPALQHTHGGGWSSHRALGCINGVDIDLSAGLVVTGPGGTLRADDAPVEKVTVTGVPGGVLLIPAGEGLARATVAGSDERRAAALDSLPHDPAARAAALAYCESRLAAAAASAAR